MYIKGKTTPPRWKIPSGFKTMDSSPLGVSLKSSVSLFFLSSKGLNAFLWNINHVCLGHRVKKKKGKDKLRIPEYSDQDQVSPDNAVGKITVAQRLKGSSKTSTEPPPSHYRPWPSILKREALMHSLLEHGICLNPSSVLCDLGQAFQPRWASLLLPIKWRKE